MRTRPNGADLLAAAQKLLREQLLPNLPAEQKHNALMIANAVGIGIRQLQTGEVAELQERGSLESILQRTVSSAQLNTANRELGVLLRAGLADPMQGSRAQVYEHLCRVVRQAVNESNPKYLT